MEWARGSAGKESDLTWLLEFLDKEIENRERSNTFKGFVKPEKSDKELKVTKSFRNPPTAAALSSVSAGSGHNGDGKKGTASPTGDCSICDKKHPTSKCFKLTKVGFEGRRELMRAKGLCFRCLVKGHLAASCNVVCSFCRGNHHFLLCLKALAPQTAEKQDKSPDPVGPVSSVTFSTDQRVDRVLMQVVPVNVVGQNGIIRANILLDSGSDKTYVTRDLVQKCQPSFAGSEYVSCASFGSSKARKQQRRNMYSLNLEGLRQEKVSVVATEIEVISVPVHRKSIPSDILKAMSHLTLVTDYAIEERVPIDMLIGLDSFWKLVKHKTFPISENMVAQETVFGWILSGSLPGSRKSVTSHQLLCICDLPDSAIRNLWDIQESDNSVSELDSQVFKEFRRHLCMKDGRYEVALPWKSGAAPQLMDNFEGAYSRLKSLNRKLDPQLKVRYDEVFAEMESEGIVEEVPPGEVESSFPTFYLPHRPVVRESSTSTKVRPVFDASAKGPNNISLNDCLEVGPNLVPKLVDILIRFRRWPIAVVADIKKAFLQIACRKEDQDVHRFLLEGENGLRIMRILRVPFGNKSSPFLLNATIKCHLEQFEIEETPVVQELKENLYVDDWLTGANSELEAKNNVAMATEIMEQANMQLTKWESNKSFVIDKAEPSEYVKVLGLGWHSSDDCFAFSGYEFGSELVCTKRVVLSMIARLFDPLGFLNPFTISLKIAFQDLWRLGVSWDEEIPEDCRNFVRQWLDDLSWLKGWKISRCYTNRPWTTECIELHVFCDSSMKAYGACVYVVYKSPIEVVSTLVLSKVKVAPLKRVTLPRLELLGAVLAAELIKLVREALFLDENMPYFCWTDSMIVLGWLKGDAFRWKQFVANRVQRVQNLTSPSSWRHCATDQNPADLVTRGISAKELVESELWLKGPSCVFVQDHSQVNDLEVEEIENHEVLVDAHESEVMVTVSSVDPLFEIERYSSLQKCLCVVAWVLRFKNNCRLSSVDRQKGELLLSELEQAKLVVFKAVQRQEYAQEVLSLQQGKPLAKSSRLFKLSPFMDEDGLLRVQGRWENADLSYQEKHPIIVPKGYFAELIVRFQHELLKHAGINQLLSSLRSTYWIIGLRRLAKRVLSRCVSCQRLDKKACEQPTPPLPSERVQQSSPFSIVGIDHAGPLYCTDAPGQKFYILLITCAVIRAVHLELVTSLGVTECVLALRKFIARRGIPKIIFSDNAKTFLATKKQFQKLYGTLCPVWKFIAPRAPWWGGWWERLVRSVKSALRKSLGLKTLTRNELDTILSEVEACINSRPLTSVDDSPRARNSPLTPAHFLIGRGNIFENDATLETPSTRISLSERQLVQESALSQFWAIWLKDYIRNLPPAKGSARTCAIAVGDLVLVREDNSPRLEWPLGVVTQLVPGQDGIVRTCRVRFRGSEFVRPIQRLHRLELAEHAESHFLDKEALPVPGSSLDQEETDFAVSGGTNRLSRFGRVIKPVQKLNL